MSRGKLAMAALVLLGVVLLVVRGGAGSAGSTAASSPGASASAGANGGGDGSGSTPAGGQQGVGTTPTPYVPTPKPQPGSLAASVDAKAFVGSFLNYIYTQAPVGSVTHVSPALQYDLSQIKNGFAGENPSSWAAVNLTVTANPDGTVHVDCDVTENGGPPKWSMAFTMSSRADGWDTTSVPSVGEVDGNGA